MAKSKRQGTSCGKNRTAKLLISNAENVKAFIILRTIVPHKFHYEPDTKQKNVSATYRDETNSETDSEFGLLLCYITYDMDFRFIPSDPVCFDKLSCCDE